MLDILVADNGINKIDIIIADTCSQQVDSLLELDKPTADLKYATPAAIFVVNCNKEKMMSVPTAYIGVILIWSTTPLAIKWSGEDVGFLFGVTGRMVLGVLGGLLVAMLLRVRLAWHVAARRTYLAAGMSIFLAMLAVYWSAQYIPSGWIAVLFGLSPLVTGLMANAWLGEQSLTPLRITGMLLGLGGLGVMFVGAEALGPDAAYGIGGVLFSVCIHSGSAVAVKRINAGIPALAVTIGGLMIAVPLFLAIYLLSEAPLPTGVPLRTGLSIIYLGFIGSVLGFKNE